MMIADAVDKTHRKHIPHQRTAAVADKGQGNSGNRKHLNGHADILEHMKGNHADNARTNICIERLIRIQRCFN